jgi:hypothetical protein
MIISLSVQPEAAWIGFIQSTDHRDYGADITSCRDVLQKDLAPGKKFYLRTGAAPP